MNVEKDEFCKPINPERRLRLRKNDKESVDKKACLSDNFDNESKKIDTTSQSSHDDDDSILDFKSPKRLHSMQSKIINSNKLPNKCKKNVLHSKPKIINNEKKSKSQRTSQNKKIVHNVQQPLIESSFFKSEKKEVESPQSSADVKTAYVCPLCFKNFKDESLQTVHMKSCATKNNISTEKLMNAVELQERQAAERKSLGLLSAPILQDKKKPAPRKMTSQDDPDLQLALALSKSLYEKEEMKQWDEAQIVAISSNSSVPDNNVECPPKMTLQSFGFSSNRNTLPTNNWPNKSKKKKPIEPTILQRRTAAERERILTERIAEILMGCKDFTQRSQEKMEKTIDDKEKIIIKSQLLERLHQIENTLWDRTKLTQTQNMFYVKELSSQITPLEKKEHKLNEERNVMELNVSIEKSLGNEQMQEINEVQTVKTTNNEKLLTLSSSTVNECCKEKKFLDDLATSWRNMLNNSSASDVIVFVKNGRHIWTHKLVFYTRCTNILLDVSANDTEFSIAKEKICWLDADYDVALAFLEFVYCGVIDKYSKVFDSETSLSGVRILGRKYKINDLFVYLRQKKSNIAEIKYDHNTYEKSTGVHSNRETTLNLSKFDQSCNTSLNYTHNVENIPCSQKVLLKKDINDDLHSTENNYTFAKDLCVLQDEKNTSLNLLEKINSRTNTPTKLETSASPDMFDDTPVTQYNDKFTSHPKDLEDSNIHILLNLIEQDADIDIYSQKVSTAKSQNAEHLELDKDISTCLKNVKQDIMEIDPDLESNSLKCSVGNKDSLIDTPHSIKSKCSQDHSSKIIKQKSNLSLFIEQIQKENAKLNAELNSEAEYPLQISPVRQKNSFYVNIRDNSEFQLHDNNVEQPINMKKKPGRLTIIEQRMRSYSAKNPEFYSGFYPNKYVEDVEQINNSYIDSSSPKKIIEPFHNNTLNYTQNFTLLNEAPKKHVNISEQVTTVSAVCSQHTETKNQSFNETNFDLETDEKEISMYSKYIRDHKDNSIAKYRPTISRNKSDSNLSNKSTSSDSINEDSNFDQAEKDEILTRSVLTQKDENIIFSETEVESISSHVSYISENDDSNHENIMSHSLQQSRKEETEDNIQDIEDSNQLLEVKKFSEAVTKSEEKGINSANKSNRDKLNITDVTSITQKSSLNELNNDQEIESILSPITVSSSPDFLNNESCNSVQNMRSLLEDELCADYVSKTDACKLKNFSLNFENDIYIANVDIAKYEKQHFMEKSQSFNTLSTRELRNDNTCRRDNESNHKNKGKDTATDNRNLNDNVITLTQNFTSIKKFKRKSLSEGQIDTSRLCNQGVTSAHTSTQLQCNYVQNLETAKVPKIIDKDVTPPPDYNNMNTPELHREMKKYGLKVQKRIRAVKLLTHIYNELHPLLPEKTIGQEITELSSEDEGPPPKKRNMDDNNLDKLDIMKDSGDELPCSQDSNDSISSEKGTSNKEMEFYESVSLSPLEKSSNITEAFMRLIDVDKDLHNKILRYEPVNIEQLRSTLRTHGFKCNLSNLMSFLDQQCITFYSLEQNAKSRTRRKS
ncbi:uncharacterized protein PF11_0213 [Monomorium pharaonis]|uniref:uncharacterized protein PF11_0213 n=1 Tax=Monomorium pharaonis TaxID=307658 RepID=UPI001745F745|nr:uncharacterized protein PF11_0213 [Monomorium pharaonis]XP_012522992.2 uncharacterized protein PF11_0213 [Monomorium pharaonis]XP_012522993.2 uncharacterized protein PF11_0213 [Monomorium pharaonis]XP_012522994.2 uncharacterized protein PF11_0213 [Monomorium pharaonis]